MDGDTNYSTFSRDQLEEALSRIDRARYPKNYKNLVNELQTRPIETVAPSAPRDLGKWVKFIGWYQLLATAILLYFTLTSRGFGLAALAHLPPPARSAVATFGIVMLCLLVVTAAAGFLTVRGHRLGPYLSVVSFGAQAISLTVPGFSFQYLPLVGFHAGWLNPDIGLSLVLGPDSKVSVGGADPTYVAVDLVSVTAIVVLVAFVKRRSAS